MHHFATDMRTFLLQNGALWDMGCAFWDLCNRPIGGDVAFCYRLLEYMSHLLFAICIATPEYIRFSWSNSLIVGIYPAASARRHALMSPPYQIILPLLMILCLSRSEFCFDTVSLKPHCLQIYFCETVSNILFNDIPWFGRVFGRLFAMPYNQYNAVGCFVQIYVLIDWIMTVEWP